MPRFSLIVLAGLSVISCSPPAVPPQPPPAKQGTAPAPAANVPLHLSRDRTLTYDSTGFGYGKVTAAYRIDEVLTASNGLLNVSFTETMTGDKSRTRQGAVNVGSEVAFDRGGALAFKFLEAAGQETVTVKAGTFKTTKFTNKGTPKYATFWVSDGIVVKVVQGDVGGNKPGTGSAELALLR